MIELLVVGLAVCSFTGALAGYFLHRANRNMLDGPQQVQSIEWDAAYEKALKDLDDEFPSAIDPKRKARYEQYASIERERKALNLGSFSTLLSPGLSAQMNQGLQQASNMQQAMLQRQLGMQQNPNPYSGLMGSGLGATNGLLQQLFNAAQQQGPNSGKKDPS